MSPLTSTFAGSSSQDSYIFGAGINYDKFSLSFFLPLIYFTYFPSIFTFLLNQVKIYESMRVNLIQFCIFNSKQTWQNGENQTFNQLAFKVLLVEIGGEIFILVKLIPRLL